MRYRDSSRLICSLFLVLASTVSVGFGHGVALAQEEPIPRLPRGPIQVITSNPGEPLSYAPIDQTACKVVDRLPGNYEYHLCSTEGGSSVPTCRFISMVEFVRFRERDDTFKVIERFIPGSREGRLTPFKYVQLWNHAGCTLIYADNNLNPTWNGANTYMSDSHTIILAFHSGSVGLLKKIQNFPLGPSGIRSVADRIEKENDEMEIPLKTLEVKSGGESPDKSVWAILEGSLPNLCYSLGRTELKWNSKENSFRVYQFAKRQSQGVCAESSEIPAHMKMTVPFTSQVLVGTLPAGSYSLLFLKEGGKLNHHTFEVEPNSA